MAIENKRWIVANHGSGDFNKNDFAYETQTISGMLILSAISPLTNNHESYLKVHKDI